MNFLTGLAPSIAAAKNGSLGNDNKPASKSRNIKGVHCHTSTIITVNFAITGSVNHFGATPKIDNMSFAGRLYDADFAQDMNKYLNQAEDVGITKYINTFNNIARPFMATLDLSSVGIQGLLAAGVHPIRAARYMTYAMASLFNPKIWDRFVVDNADEIDDFIRGGGYWSDLDDAGDFMFTKGNSW